MKSGAPPIGHVLTVSRGMQVLRAFRCERSPLSHAELVRRTGLPKATVSRLTTTLVELGFLRRPPGSRKFELASGALPIGHAFVASSALLRAAEECMQDLADRLGVSVALAVRNGLDMLYVAYRAGHAVATLRLGVGTVLPMGATAAGHAYLWAQPRDEQARLLRALEDAGGARRGAMSAAIRDSFAELERDGTCGVLGQFQRDAFGVSLPIRVGRHRRVMAMSCGKAEIRPDFAAERARISPALKAAAARLELVLADFDGEP